VRKSLNLKLTGALDIYMVDEKTGKVVEERHIKNDIVDSGEIWIAELLANEYLDDSAMDQGAGAIGNGLQYIHIGTSSSPTTQGMFNLQGYTGITTYYVSCTGSRDVQSPGNKIVATGTYATDVGNGTLHEAGLFSTSIGTDISTMTSHTGRMFNRTTFATITKTTDFSLTLQWTITIGSVS